MSAPDLPRFKVVSVSGYSGGPTGAKRPATSYSVLDTWNVCREVAAFYTSNRGEQAATREARARGRCAELEAWHAKAMADA